MGKTNLAFTYLTTMWRKISASTNALGMFHLHTQWPRTFNGLVCVRKSFSPFKIEGREKTGQRANLQFKERVLLCKKDRIRYSIAFWFSACSLYLYILFTNFSPTMGNSPCLIFTTILQYLFFVKDHVATDNLLN